MSLLAVAGLIGLPAASAAVTTTSVTHPAAPAPIKASAESAPVGPGAASVGQAAAISHVAVAATATKDGKGFWVVYADGSVTAEGDAVFYGDMAGAALGAPMVGIAATADGGGYWLLGADGGVFSFGDAGFHGSTGNIHLNAPALQMTSTADGAGYDFVASDGGIFTFGDASYHGSAGATALTAPITAMATTADGQGYWLIAGDGGVFSYGDAGYHGSAVGQTGGVKAIGIVATHDGGGYWAVLANGTVLAYGDATPVAAATVADNRYAFEVTNAAGVPARWNSCDPVHYAVVSAGAPAGWQADVTNDIAQVSAATGLTFVNDGTFAAKSAVPASSKITISWAAASTLSGGDDLGLTTFYYYNDAGYTPQMVGATIQLVPTATAGGGLNGEQPVLLHELGHAVGMAHTPNAPEVMNPYDQGFGTYQPGDLSGLAKLGASQGCTGFQYP